MSKRGEFSNANHTQINSYRSGAGHGHDDATGALRREEGVAGREGRDVSDMRIQPQKGAGTPGWR